MAPVLLFLFLHRTLLMQAQHEQYHVLFLASYRNGSMDSRMTTC
jgi:hypothetical protein